MKKEKVNFSNSRGLNIVGVFHFPDNKTNKVIVISHGFTSNKDRIRTVRTAEKLSEEGFAALRFDSCGSGESDFDSVTVKKYLDDLESAIDFVKSRGYRKIGLVGESLGGLTSILAYNKEIKFMVLEAPVTKAKKPGFVEDKAMERQIRDSGFALYKKDGRDFKIEGKYLKERENVNQKEILSRIECPVLIIHGDKDKTIPLEHSKEALNYIQKSRLEIVKGADHKFSGYEKELVDICSKWVKENFN